MRILQLCKKFPWPARDGESVAVTHLSKALSQEGAEVSLLAMNTIKHRFEQNALPEALRHYAKVDKVPVDNRIKPLQALYNLVFSRESYHIRRFVVPAFAERLKKWLQEEEFDVVLLETLYLMPYVDVIRKYSKAKILLRSHNVEHEIWERIAANERNLLKRSYLEVLARRLKAYELEQLHRA
ncbi:MAG TPA: glycosyl transferase family 1, partial [Phaeodactylibacter sp.]|nr:glycosyl transferase family 1 [Phaeodactylibacter sp.]